jgi:predicted metal-binding protein
VNIAIMGCKEIKDETCIGCQRCLTALHRREGEFERYKNDLRDWLTPMGEKVDVLHLGTCVKNHCQYKVVLVQAVKAKAGVEVVEGSHPYVPQNIFAS